MSDKNTRWDLISINHAKLKSPSSIVPIPKEFHSLLAHTATIWGLFEKNFNDFLIAMVQKNRTKYREGWRFSSFEDRQAMFLDEAEKCFAASPNILSYLKQVVQDSEGSQIKRNVLLHGHIALGQQHDADGGPYTVLHVSGRRKKQDIAFDFTFDDIESLFYDLAHLAGRVAEFKPERLYFPQFSSQEKSELLAFLADNHPAHSKPAIPDTPPQS